MAPPTKYPAEPSALFNAVHEAYKNLDVIDDRRQGIKDELLRLNQTVPPPLDRIRELQDQLYRIDEVISKGNREALRLNNVAILGLLKSSDVVNATKAIDCTNSKARLALDNLAQFQNFLSVSAAIVTFVGSLAAAAAAAPVSFLQIATLIEQFDSMINMELAETLSPEDLADIMPRIKKDCTKAA